MYFLLDIKLLYFCPVHVVYLVMFPSAQQIVIFIIFINLKKVIYYLEAMKGNKQIYPQNLRCFKYLSECELYTTEILINPHV